MDELVKTEVAGLEVPMKEAFTWIAIYDSSLILREIDGFSYGDIDREKLVEFWLIDQRGQEKIKIDLKPGQKLIFRRRRFQRAVESTPFQTFYLVGWHENISGRNVQSIMYLYPNGAIELSDSKSDLELLNFEI